MSDDHDPNVGELAAHFLAESRARFAKLKTLAEDAVAQVGDAEYFAALGPDENSLAVLTAHLAGNLRSRWTDFLASDGEKPDRDRDREFELEPDLTRAALAERWEHGWQSLFEAFAALEPADLLRTVTIRGEPHTVVQAVQRQLAHYGYHVGQIVQLARHHAGARWHTLSIPRAGSRSFNDEMTRRTRG